ncbi:hypothetical protein COCC4DRAFT_60565 [Bipolaris maydis ATCC 48331]|uniref:Uncharacterized protein n=1 Tax=Cochliobolus heterostrophus (strain C4 / ATCC 48331 / race T) TaxID=665024 RepID=N4XAG9_COCH4|nr:uncharacterized protein COCC4DRAFT_60565 [Bipolaris maydis ATCC 48331]ENI05513.1 hypothetical protein COCC4DRAFT_60565 [Bipolaris maydis ATCC 48331]
MNATDTSDATWTLITYHRGLSNRSPNIAVFLESHGTKASQSQSKQICESVDVQRIHVTVSDLCLHSAVWSPSRRLEILCVNNEALMVDHNTDSE